MDYKKQSENEKIKQDMLFLAQEMLAIKQEIAEIRQILLNFQSNTNPNTYATEVRHPTHNPTDNLPNYALIQPNFHSSIGNDGVPTDTQQTHNRHSNTQKQAQNRIINSDEIISTLGTLKQDLREKFKTLTKQEFLIFSILYTLEEELKIVTYKDIAQRTSLAESSIRDYISRLERKGLPIIKERVNNKVVILKIPRELKEIASLNNLSNV